MKATSERIVASRIDPDSGRGIGAASRGKRQQVEPLSAAISPLAPRLSPSSISKVGIPKFAYRGSPHGISQQFPDAPELRSSTPDWAWNAIACRNLAAQKTRDAIVISALAALQNLTPRNVQQMNLGQSVGRNVGR